MRAVTSRLVTTMMVVGCCVVAACACTRSTAGQPTVGAGMSPSRTTPTSTAVRAPEGPVTPLLLAPADFPQDYPATVLDPQSAGEALRDIDGVPAGARVEPSSCAPAPPPSAPLDVAAAVGVNEADSSTITVAVTRVAQPLADYKAQLERCTTFAVTSADQVNSTVTVEQAVAPPINADDSVALNQTVSSDSQSGAQTTLTLVAQITNIRILATYMTFQGTEPDAVLLDQVFTAAVLKVHDNIR
jgi:hypothetical protein